MKLWAVFGGTVLLCGFFAAQQAVDHASIAASPIVEVKGRIVRVQAAPAQGTATLEVEQSDRTIQVLLGPLRYLMEQNFNPRAGAFVKLKGFRTGDKVVAISVTLHGANKTLRLRDEAGWPLWEAGKHK